MFDNIKINNTNELEFAVFCIENIASRLERNAEEIYKMLTEESNILSDLAVEFSAKFYGHKAENENQGRNRIK